MFSNENRPSTKETIHILKEIQKGKEEILMDVSNKYPNLHCTELSYEKTGDTALHCASRLGLINIIECLVANFDPTSVDCKNNDDKTALHEAAQFSQYEACEALLKYGANVNALKKADWTPLMLACTKISGDNSLKTVRLLLENGAIVNYQNKDGWSALHLICREGNIEILKLLLDHGLDVKLKTKNGRTGLHVAALHGNVETIKILLELNIDVDEVDGCGNTPLQEAVLGGNIEACKVLIDRNADVHRKNNRGYSILHLAASEGHLDIINFVLSDLNWDINEKTKDGFTALHCAARNNRKDAFEYLKSKGADLSIEDNCNRDAVSYLSA